MGGARQRPDAPVTIRPILAAAGALSLALVASCTPRVVPEPRPAPPPPAAPAPPPPAPLAGDWQDWPLTPGTWVYRQSPSDQSARYGPPASEALLTISCDRTARRISVSVPRTDGATDGRMLTIRTSYGVLQWPAAASGGAMPQLVATRAASDQGFDWILFSRGRFTVEVPGHAALVLPTWAEPARVVEDCRG